METEELISEIIQCAYKVHLALPPGYHERVYQRALIIELRDNDLNAKSEVSFSATYKGQIVGDFRVDIIVENKVILELKAIDNLLPVNGVQLVNYLTMAGIDHGLLINFGSTQLQVQRKFRLKKKMT